MKRSILFVAMVAVGVLGGCVDLAQVHKMRDDAVKLREALQADEKQWEGRVASLPEYDPLRADAQAALAGAKAREEAVDAAVQELDLVIKNAQNPDDPILSVGAPMLPEPLRSPVLLGGALLAAIARAVQLKRGVASVAQSLQKAMDDDEQFRAGMKKHANTLRSIQTKTAQKIVDQATGKGPALSLPI